MRADNVISQGSYAILAEAYRCMEALLGEVVAPRPGLLSP
jgi:hypothetical protein